MFNSTETRNTEQANGNSGIIDLGRIRQEAEETITLLERAISLKQAVRQTTADVFAHYDTANLKVELQAMPERIRSARQALRSARRTYDEALEALRQEEAILTMAIADEINPDTGKKRFSNKESRDAELIKRQLTDDGYRAAKERVAVTQEALDNAQLELDLVLDRKRALEKVADLTAAELAILAS